MNQTSSTPEQWLAESAVQLGGRVENMTVILDKKDEIGSASLHVLEEGLTLILTEVKSNAVISNLKLNLPEDYLFIKLYLPDNHFNTLARFEQEHLKITSPGVLLYNSRLYLKSFFNVRSQYKVVSFAMHADWIGKTFAGDTFLTKNQLIGKPYFRFKRVTPALLQSALNLFLLKIENGIVNLRIRAIAYEILNQVFSAINENDEINSTIVKNEADVEAILKVSQLLLDTEHQEYLTTERLAKVVGMSPTKLKRVFRSVFGMSIFEFYQHHRLTHAKYLIEERKYSIKEIGLKIGYNNLSKFSQAYKKQFGFLPHQTLMTDRAII